MEYAVSGTARRAISVSGRLCATLGLPRVGRSSPLCSCTEAAGAESCAHSLPAALPISPPLPPLAVTDWPEDTQSEGLTAVLPRSDRGALIAALDSVSQEEKVA